MSLSIPQAHERPGTAGAAVIAIDLALRAGWKRLPDPATAWAARHRTRMVVGATLVIPVALNPAALLLVAVTAYVAQARPRRPLRPLAPMLWTLPATSLVVSCTADADGGDGGAGSATMLWALAAVLLVQCAHAISLRLTSGVLGLDPAVHGLPSAILLGRTRQGWLAAPTQTGALVIGPPRSGKTSGVVVPNVMAWPGPVVTATTRRDVLDACAGIRSVRGTAWCFAPASSLALPDRVGSLHWSPLRGCASYTTAWAPPISCRLRPIRARPISFSLVNCACSKASTY